MRVRLIYQADGDRVERTFRTIDAARRWTLSKLGPAPEVCEPFGFVMNGDEVVIPVTCSVQQLLGRRRRETR